MSRLVETLTVSLPPGRVVLGVEDVTSAIRANEVTRASQYLADSPSVRQRLMVWQRAFAASHHVVSEGRDQGTLVFPNAFRKYFLTASDEERARRRLCEYRTRDEAASYESVLGEQREGDARDASRKIAPMKPAFDAIVIDTTGSTIEDVVDRMAREIAEQLDRSRAPIATPGGVA